MTRVQNVVGLVVALAVAAGVSVISDVKIAPKDQHDAVLRLSWSARPERIETCQAQSEEMQAKLPAHMRQPVICEGTSAVYRLQVWREENLLLDELVRGGGLRHDRLLYVFREIPQAVGDTTITIRLRRLDMPSVSGTPAERAEAAKAVSDLPASLVFERRLHFAQGRVILVTYDTESREFVSSEG